MCQRLNFIYYYCYNYFLVIGVPKEVSHLEKRVSLCPKQVRNLTKLGFKIKVEEGAGVAAFFEDEDYIRNGA